MNEVNLFPTISEAVEDDDVARVKQLIEGNPAELETDTPFGTWINYAASVGSFNVVTQLAAMGARINARGGVAKCNALSSAASEGHWEIVRFLYELGSTFNVDLPESNPLFNAIQGAHVAVVKFLIDHGIDAHVIYRGQSGILKNALSFAMQYRNQEIIDMLKASECRLPVEGVDVAVNEPAVSPVVPSLQDRRHEQIIAYLRAQFGSVDSLALLEIVPVLDDVHVAINVIRPNEKHSYLTLFTTGLSDRPMQTPPGEEAFRFAELVMFLPADWPHPREVDGEDESLWTVEWLRQLAYYPHLYETWLGSPSTIISSDDPPVPLGASTKQTCLLLLPNLGKLQPLAVEEGVAITFYNVTTLYTEERDYELQHGAKAFLKRFLDQDLSHVVNLSRKNFAKT